MVPVPLSESYTRREIASKQARVAYLAQFLRDNLPLTASRIAAGFFMTEADALRQFAGMCEEISRLNAEIVQLRIELEPRVFQLELAHS